MITIVLLSFTKCVTVTEYPGYSTWSIDRGNMQLVVSTVRYSPVYICVLTSIELILLWAVKKRFTCWIGIFLNIAATMGPFCNKLLHSYVSRQFSKIMFDYDAGYVTYSFSFFVFLIIALGIAITVLYFLLFRFRKNISKYEKN